MYFKTGIYSFEFLFVDNIGHFQTDVTFILTFDSGHEMSMPRNELSFILKHITGFL